MDYQTILVIVEDGIAAVTLNRPGYSNTFARESYAETTNAMKNLGSRRGMGPAVITGAGRHFSVGGNIKRFKALIDSKGYLDGDSVTGAGNMSIVIHKCPEPVTVMINGVTTGAGLSCALICGFRVVTFSSKMIMAFVNMGLYGDTGGIYSLIHLIGPDKAELLIVTGDAYREEGCIRMGLTAFLVEEDKLREATYNLASKLARKFSVAHAGQRHPIRRYFYEGLADLIVGEGEKIVTASCLSDSTEAANAFLKEGTPEYNK